MADQNQATETTVLLPKFFKKISPAFQQFCVALGINDGTYEAMTKDGIYLQIKTSIRWQRGYYYTWTAVASILVVLQLGVGLTISLLTGLRGEKAHTTVIVLGAVNSFVGGLAAFLQYRGQPGRSGKMLQALQEITDGIHEDIANFAGDVNYKGHAADLIQKFSKAKSESFANEPLVYDRIIRPEQPQQPVGAREVQGHGAVNSSPRPSHESQEQLIARNDQGQGPDAEVNQPQAHPVDEQAPPVEVQAPGEH